MNESENTVRCICIWLDTIGSPGEPAWIVSLDELDDRGRADSTHTLRSYEVDLDEDGEIDEASLNAELADAELWAVRVAAKRGLPVWRNSERGPAEQYLSAAEAQARAAEAY